MRRAEAREKRLAASQSQEAAAAAEAEAAPRAIGARAAKARDPSMYEWLQVSHAGFRVQS